MIVWQRLALLPTLAILLGQTAPPLPTLPEGASQDALLYCAGYRAFVEPAAKDKWSLLPLVQSAFKFSEEVARERISSAFLQIGHNKTKSRSGVDQMFEAYQHCGQLFGFTPHPEARASLDQFYNFKQAEHERNRQAERAKQAQAEAYCSPIHAKASRVIDGVIEAEKNGSLRMSHTEYSLAAYYNNACVSLKSLRRDAELLNCPASYTAGISENIMNAHKKSREAYPYESNDFLC